MVEACPAGRHAATGAGQVKGADVLAGFALGLVVGFGAVFGWAILAAAKDDEQ